MFENHTLREKVYLGLSLLLIIGFFLNNYAAQKTTESCIKANTKLNQYIQDISDGKIQPTLKDHGTNNTFGNLTLYLPNN